MNVIDKVIYLYLFICVFLLLFNFLYILRSGRVKRMEKFRVGRWEKELNAVIPGFREYREVPLEHLQLLGKRLCRIHELTAYRSAVFQRENSVAQEDLRAYFSACRPVFLELAWKYRKKAPMERAFFAYMVSVCFPHSEMVHDRMAEALLSYLEDSTVYCRENVLRGLYVLGNVSAVGQAFDYMSKRGWYHHPRLISDGMQTFSGDREELIRYLWKRRSSIEECLVVGIVQFATNVSGAFSREFAEAMQDQTEGLEVRLALVRYFRRYPSREVYPLLVRYLLQNEETIEFTIVAASVLGAYPGAETKAALKEALHSRNWYVRKNAALSLKQLGITAEDREEIAACGDCYANEILSYMAERESV